MDTVDIKIRKGIKAARVILKHKNDRAMALVISQAESALKKAATPHEKASLARMLRHFVKDNAPIP